MALEAFADLSVTSPDIKASRPIDLVHLAKQCLGDENLELEILRLFDKTMATYFDRLKHAASFDDLAVNLHALKGASAGVGAWAVADIAQVMEHELREGRPLAIERIDDLGVAVEEVRGFISRMLLNEQNEK